MHLNLLMQKKQSTLTYIYIFILLLKLHLINFLTIFGKSNLIDHIDF